MSVIGNLEALLARGKDSSMLRFGLGKAYLEAGEPSRAVEHLRQAVHLQPEYSAAWKLLGRALQDSGDIPAAKDAYGRGLQVAETNGDVQAAREMRVFLKRLG